MSDHGDFVDDYIEYRIFEESMKRSGGGKMPKRNSGGLWVRHMDNPCCDLDNCSDPARLMHRQFR